MITLLERLRLRSRNLDMNQFLRVDCQQAADEIERLQTENRVLWLCVRNKATEQQSLESVKRGDYVTSEQLLAEIKARQP